MKTESTIEIITSAIARAFFVSAWADREEEKGRTKGWAGQDLMKLAPKTPRVATLEAWRALGALEATNKTNIYALLAQAWKADGHSDELETPATYARDFGHYLGMMMLGHGVGWFDDHAEFELETPHWEYIL